MHSPGLRSSYVVWIERFPWCMSASMSNRVQTTHPLTTHHSLTHPLTYAPTHPRTHALTHVPQHARTHTIATAMHSTQIWLFRQSLAAARGACKFIWMAAPESWRLGHPVRCGVHWHRGWTAFVDYSHRWPRVSGGLCFFSWWGSPVATHKVFSGVFFGRQRSFSCCDRFWIGSCAYRPVSTDE